MKKYSFALFCGLFVSALVMFSPISQADTQQQLDLREQQLNQREQELNKREQQLNAANKTYGDKVAEKALLGVTNLGTAPLEMPKSLINVTNESNVIYGLIGGTAKGIVNAAGRAAAGLIDLFTAPIVTLPTVNPNYIWDDFDAETTYSPLFRLDNEKTDNAAEK